MLNYFSRFKILIVGVLLVLVVGFFLLVFFSKNGNGGSATPTPLPVPSDYTKNYTNLNMVRPGKTTYEDLVGLIGYPQNSSRSADKTFLYYPTPLGIYKNTVVLKNNIVYYAIENVFGSYRGKLDDFVKKYGNEDLKMYKEEERYTWYVFLRQGIVVESDYSGETITITYFIPQDKQSFIDFAQREFGLSTDFGEILD